MRGGEQGDFREFHEVGLLGPAAELGERSPREVAHKPSAINHNARGGVSHQSEQSPVEAGNLPAKIDKAARRNSKTYIAKHA